MLGKTKAAYLEDYAEIIMQRESNPEKARQDVVALYLFESLVHGQGDQEVILAGLEEKELANPE